MLPRFLVISPPKTGSTWLADNLRRHPQLFVPAIKEVKYFNTFFHWFDSQWYSDHFPATRDRIAGEASPSYASLPVERIRAIRELLPDVRLVFLTRDPVARAWSHARHLHRYREASLESCDTPIERMTAKQWQAAFDDEWLRISGDYAGQLRRWRSVFPAHQFHIGSFQSIVERPAELLRELFAFLGVDPDIDLAGFPLHERILEGPAVEMPAECENYLRDAFGGPTEERVRYSEADLERNMAREATFRTAFRQLRLGHRGYDLVFHRGRLLAVPREWPADSVEALESLPLEELIGQRTILTAPTWAELQEQVANRVIERADDRFRAMEEQLRAVRAEAASLRTALEELTDEVRRPLPRPLWMRTIRGVGRRLKRLPVARLFFT